ncbi:oligoendopeptidase F family protein [candidate division KSB1 bacterium]|nr:MAG: oligoendopeptidase F family protein [candidate division KSB1 bacterium]
MHTSYSSYLFIVQEKTMRKLYCPKAIWIILALMLPFLLISVESALAQTKEIKERSEIPEKYKWDLSALYKSDDAWEADFKVVEGMIPSIKSYEGKISKSGADMLAYFKLTEDAAKKVENMQVYAGMSFDQDTRNQKYTGFKDRIQTLAAQFGEAASWFTPELVSIPDATFEKWYKEVPGLAMYRHGIDDELRTRAHTLSPAEEKLLALSSNVAQCPTNANTALRIADIKFPTVKDEDGNDVQLSEGRAFMLMESSDKRVRRDAAIKLLETYMQYQNTAAALMSGNMAGDVFYARARNYNSSLHASLDADNIDTTVFLNLVASVKKNVGALQKYVDLRRRALGLDFIHSYDMVTPLIAETRETVPYDKAVTTITTAMAPMGKDYGEAMAKVFNSRWVDVYETKNKQAGAYSWGTFMSHPYMLLNYNETLDDMFTTAHELGHAVHTYYSHKTQPYTYSGYTLFNAEVASTFNEALLMDHLLKTEKNPAKRLYLVNQYIDNFRGTVFTQVMFADFELKMHRAAEAGEPLTAESLSEMYMQTLKEFYGPGIDDSSGTDDSNLLFSYKETFDPTTRDTSVTMQIGDTTYHVGGESNLVSVNTHFVYDPQYAYTWIRIPHFYRNFYVYKYATGFLSAQALSQKVLKGEKGAHEAYIGYLSSGSSKYPLDLLKDAGVDLTKPDAVEAGMKKFGELVDEMERLLKQTGKIK